jgi:hypothetical protein
MTQDSELEKVRQQAQDHWDHERWPEAIAAYRQAIALDPNDGDSYNQLGVLYEMAGDAAETEQAFLKALELSPDATDALINIGCFYMDQERWDEALLTLQWCARSTPLASDLHSEAMGYVTEILNEHAPELQAARWVQVSETLGYMAAEMTASYLRSAGILAWAWQESAGEAFGLRVGALGAGHVVVREQDEAEARALLDELDEEWAEEAASATDESETDEAGSISKAVLGATAVVLNPFGAGLAALLTQFKRFSQSDLDVTCPHCGAELVLDEAEWEERWYQCPDCDREVFLDE